MGTPIRMSQRSRAGSGSILLAGGPVLPEPMVSRRFRFIVFALVFAGATSVTPAASVEQPTHLVPEAVFDGVDLHRGWVVLVDRNTIAAAGPSSEVDATATTRLPLPGLTLLPGLIEGHSHLLLHPYDETPWADQVLADSEA